MFFVYPKNGMRGTVYRQICRERAQNAEICVFWGEKARKALVEKFLNKKRCLRGLVTQAGVVFFSLIVI